MNLKVGKCSSTEFYVIKDNIFICHVNIRQPQRARKILITDPPLDATIFTCDEYQHHPNQGPMWLIIFIFNQNLMTTCGISVLVNQITTRFCTWHDSSAVMSCAKLCSDQCIRFYIGGKWNCNEIWIMMDTNHEWNSPWCAELLSMNNLCNPQHL